MFRRIIAVHSFQDDGAEARMKAAALSPVFDDADLLHLCMLDRARSPRLMAEVDRIFEETTHAGFSVAEKDSLRTKAVARVVEEDFLPVLRDAISNHGAELCVFHSGTVFTMCAGTLLKGVIEISGTRPELKWGLEDQSAWIFDHSQRARKAWGFEQKAIVAQYKHVRRHFTTGEEVNRVLTAIYG